MVIFFCKIFFFYPNLCAGGAVGLKMISLGIYLDSLIGEEKKKFNIFLQRGILYVCVVYQFFRTFPLLGMEIYSILEYEYFNLMGCDYRLNTGII